MRRDPYLLLGSSESVATPGTADTDGERGRDQYTRLTGEEEGRGGEEEGEGEGERRRVIQVY